MDVIFLNFREQKIGCFGKKLYICNRIGKMQEWLNWHAWKACKRLKRFGGSNPPLSAENQEFRSKILISFLF